MRGTEAQREEKEKRKTNVVVGDIQRGRCVRGEK